MRQTLSGFHREQHWIGAISRIVLVGEHWSSSFPGPLVQDGRDGTVDAANAREPDRPGQSRAHLLLATDIVVP